MFRRIRTAFTLASMLWAVFCTGLATHAVIGAALYHCGAGIWPASVIGSIAGISTGAALCERFKMDDVIG